VVIAGRELADDEGFFDDFEAWSEEIFEALATRAGFH
jgi:sulfur relay (sulfurtransferase) DsrC/TusE family protein